MAKKVPAGVRAYLSAIGSIKSEKKAASSRENGKKGGRPKKDESRATMVEKHRASLERLGRKSD